jgi:serine phosphatase RsbU (regulator of sigma subunit)
MVHLDIEDGGRIRTVQLNDGRHVIGRGEGADLQVESATVSRIHAALDVQEGEVWVEDLGSTWGTFLGTSRLAHGDRQRFPRGELLRVARVQLWSHDAPRPRAPIQDEDVTETGGHFVTGFGTQRRTLPMLRHLFEIMSTDEEGHAIEREACLFVKNWVDADRVCLFETSDAGVAPTLRFAWSRREVDAEGLGISRCVVDGVLTTDEPTRWFLDDGELDPMDSRHRFGIHAAVAVPLQGNFPIRGVLYADRRNRGPAYSDDDVEILTATAAAVAMRRAISNSRQETLRAARIQKSMLPPELPELPGFEIEAGLHMCHGVGGDLYDCICRGDYRCLFSVGDVSGKGLPAALIMGATSYLVRALADLDLSPLEIYKRVHSNLLAKYRMRQYVALFIGELDHRTGSLRCVVAGVPRPLVIRASGEVEELPVTAFAAALIDLDEPPPEDFVTTLETGDLLAIFSDGYPEATPDGDRFLEAAVEDQLVRDRHLPLPRIRARLDQTVEEFVGTAGPSDDRTLMLVRRCDG